MGTIAVENKYSFLGGRDFFGLYFNPNTYMGLPENRNEWFSSDSTGLPF